MDLLLVDLIVGIWDADASLSPQRVPVIVGSRGRVHSQLHLGYLWSYLYILYPYVFVVHRNKQTRFISSNSGPAVIATIGFGFAENRNYS